MPKAPRGGRLHNLRNNLAVETKPGSLREALELPLLGEQSLAQLSESGPVMLVFLRHFGCTFCREQLMDLGAGYADLERAGIRLVFVHMGADDYAREFLKRFGLERAARIADPSKTIYAAFSLPRARPVQVFSLGVWLRALAVGLHKKIWGGPIIGDPWQMPGLFLIQNGEIAYSYIPQLVSDVPDLSKVLQLRSSGSN